MGCASSKRVKPCPPPPHPPHQRSSTVPVRRNASSVGSEQFVPGFEQGRSRKLERIWEEPEKENGSEADEDKVEGPRCSNDGVSEGLPKQVSMKKVGSQKKAATFTFRFGRYTEEDPVAAGWPTWLSTVAAEAVEGWSPLRPDLFEKLDKIGQGTYSSVYRARNVETGKLFALKKVRFDTFQPESVRFMAREITILRRLDHPNIMKLEGLIANRLSCSIYLVFEYMEHDLAGLLSCPDIKFSDAQIKCYMKQLLAGLEHCHSRGVMHRDIKTSNILLNNQGNLKIADFGLANYTNLRHQQSLTSRVVTLWYRPPELLMGSTNYGPSVDLWSAGCVFAELFIGKPILKGRTEVEQLHRIFKLCGSPPDEYWRKHKLPLATMFRTQHPYPCSLREMFNEFPKSAVRLLESFLSMDPHKRGTASSALDSEYFRTKPYACDPSSLPSYPPNKEIDAKLREGLRRRKAGRRTRPSGTSKKHEMETGGQCSRGCNGTGAYSLKGREVPKSSVSTVSEAASQATDVSRVTSVRSVPVLLSSNSSSGFALSKKRKGNGVIPTRSYNQSNSRLENSTSLDPPLDSDNEHEKEPNDDEAAAAAAATRSAATRRRKRDQPCGVSD